MKKTILCLCVMLGTVGAFSGTASADPGLLAKISDAEARALNIFFSNFCETSFGDFNAKARDDQALIAFAAHHNVINNRKLFKEDKAEGKAYIGKGTVDATIEKYFGLKGVTPQSAEDGFVIYKNGKYYWDDVFESAPWFAGGQAVSLTDNGDGTLFATVELYKDNDAFQKDAAKVNIKDFYAPKKSWKGKTASYYELSSTWSAVIAPHTYNGKKTWKLLEWREEGASNE
jgi:hypothetical protein